MSEEKDVLLFLLTPLWSVSVVMFDFCLDLLYISRSRCCSRLRGNFSLPPRVSGAQPASPWERVCFRSRISGTVVISVSFSDFCVLGASLFWADPVLPVSAPEVPAPPFSEATPLVPSPTCTQSSPSDTELSIIRPVTGVENGIAKGQEVHASHLDDCR